MNTQDILQGVRDWTNTNNGAYDISAKTGDTYLSLSDAVINVPNELRRGGMSVKFIQTTPATYTVVKTEGVETQPTGTEVQEALSFENGTYTAAQMTGVTPPASGSVTYYLAVTETVDEQEVTTYTTWVITYVQSSDNKYVQYRLMPSTFTAAQFANPTNWQGVDDEPTAGSNNIVKSGGVFDSICKIEEEAYNNFSEITGVKNYIEDKKINSTGLITTQNGYCLSIHIPVKNGDRVRWDMGPSDIAIGLNVYDEVGQKLTTWTNSGSSTSGTRTITIVNETASYIVCTFSSDESFEHKVFVNYKLVWAKHDDGDLIVLNERVTTIESEDIPEIKEELDSLDDRIFDCEEFIKTTGEYIENYAISRNTEQIVVADGWRCTVDNVFIPTNPGDTIVYNYGKAKSNYCIKEYDENKNYLNYYSAQNGGASCIRTVAARGSYIKACWYSETAEGDENIAPLTINGNIVELKPYKIGKFEELENRIDTLEDIVEPKEDEYGTIGINYPEQIPDIVDKLSYRFSNRFHFLHLSDNHNSIYGYANELLDYIPAKFLVNTGDMVADKFSDSKANTIACSISPIKPTYLVLGNHDYSHATSKQDVFDAFYGDDETEGTVNYHNVQTGGVATDKTYYSVDFATEGIKCIFLDMNEGHSDEDLPDLNPNTGLYGKMTQTQIEWFVSELQDAITNDLHVCIFIHALPSRGVPVYAETIDTFLDLNYIGYSSYSGHSQYTCFRLSFLLDIVDAFINGESVTFTYSEHEYTFTFASAGHLVAWFAGHLHYDAAGWLTEHENQFAINVCRPTPNSGGYLGTYDEDKLGVHFNYVTIDTGLKSLSIYRVGQQDTVYATQRKSFRILYK